MIISYNWLKDYLNFNETPEELSVILTDIGLEVSTIAEFCSVEGGLDGLVIGKVLTCERHPNADKLSLTTVDVGGESALPIVCGAPNVAAGQTVVVASVGTTLYPAEGESFLIKKAKIRGEVSEGMICAEDEIGIGASHDGILVLPYELNVGIPASEYFNVEFDYSIEIDLTPNRIDAASHIGVARDLAAFFSMGKLVKAELPSIESFKVDSNDLTVSVEVPNSDLCNRYMGLTLKNIKVEPSPEWLQNRINAIGLNPINNIVDITNFVMHETGQPLHAFDVDKIAGNKIVVKTLAEDTQFVTLDDVTRKLSSDDLMICNSTEGMCIAGVFGGLDSGISESSTDVFIESAYFNPGAIRKTARRHGLNTDSSFRYERGADINMAPYALKRAAILMKEIAGGTISSDIVDVYPNKLEPVEVSVNYRNINRLIGKEIPKAVVKSILAGLEFEIINETDEELNTIVPLYRVDVTRDVDVIEEILRIYGYNNIEAPSQLRSSLSYSDYPDGEKLIDTASSFLNSHGFSEIMCTSISNKDFYQNTDLNDLLVHLHNPLNNDLNCMRADIIYGGLESISRNIRYKKSDIKFFEFGSIYQKKTSEVEINKADSYQESLRLGLWLTGMQESVNWHNKDKPSDIFQLKASVELVLSRFGVDVSTIETEEVSDYRFTYGLTYSIKGKHIVKLGSVKEDILKSIDIEQDVFFADIDWEAIVSLAKTQSTGFKEISNFQQVRRDLALLIDKNVSYKQIKKLAQNTEKKYLMDVQLFDVYEGKKLPQDKKSYAVMFVLQDCSKTMSDKQIDKIMKRLIAAFTQELGAEIR